MEYRDNVFYSPEGNAEVWDSKPEGYFTEKEWMEAHPPAPAPEATLDEMKAFKKALMADARYQEEISGLDFHGNNILTDHQSQLKITGAALQATNDPSYTCNWKTADGTFVVLNAQTILAIATAVRQHVQASFDKEAQKVAAINAAQNKEDLDAIVW